MKNNFKITPINGMGNYGIYVENYNPYFQEEFTKEYDRKIAELRKFTKEQLDEN